MFKDLESRYYRDDKEKLQKKKKKKIRGRYQRLSKE